MANARPAKSSAMFYKLVYRALTVRIDRVFLAFAALSLGSAVITALLSLYLDIKVKMSEELRAYGANFVIRSTLDTPHSLPIRDLQKAIQLLPKDKLIGSTPIIYGITHLPLGDAILSGVSFQGLRQVSPYWQVQGNWIGVDFDDRNTMVGTNLAKSMELKPGDNLSLSGERPDQSVKLHIRGIIESGGPEDNQVFVSLPIAEKLLAQSDTVDFGLISVSASGSEADRYATDISSKLRNIEAKPVRNLSQSDGLILDKIDGLMALVAAFILVMTTLCVNSTLTSMIAERTREIGLQKALGASNASIIKQFLCEAILISGIGATFGLILGFGLAQILGLTIFGGLVTIHGIVIPIVTTVGIVIGTLAAITPARRSTKVSPALTLRGE